MERILKWSILSSIILLFACTDKPKANSQEELLKNGSWLMEMTLAPNVILPFQFNLEEKDNIWKMSIYNAEEVIETTELSWNKDTLTVQLPVFESEFKLVKKSASSLEGNWFNYYKGPDYKIPVTATFGESKRFSAATDNYSNNLGGKYEVVFSPNSKDPSNAIGLFEQDGNEITGTFATETGDYRHLEGNVIDNKIYLSTFDGSHAFLFEALQTDTGLVGTFYSGTHWKENWVATKNDSVKLRNPNNLTFLKDGYEKIAFEFPDTEGNVVSLEDKRFKNKAIIIQIMGSWCPNCLDETKYLTQLYDKYKSEGLEVVALAFERTSSEEKALKNLARLKAKTGAKYTFLLGGATRNDKAEEKLPMLNHIMSYPTAIFIDKKGNVRRIHTGFYGPSTGEYYTSFVQETEELVNELLSESKAH